MTKKQSLRKTADELWKMACVKRWGQNSIISGEPAQTIHHFFGKNRFPILRHNLDNGCPLTNGEHYAHHHCGDPTIHQTIAKNRGEIWFKRLEEISKEKFISGNTVGYYRKTIKELTDYLQNA